ncbi:peptidylprolyl isomerase [Geminocystis sp. GBBB08]|uniref:peptidylprolyl isomerase n=1 Tax=Geminocystis sp. GBBB08 TaxID=2604140 RepID=UPI0027E2F8A4|nr:peptidylprolyl isomerase [Geminocystis sp. GBBB08]MBL1210800.1 peptidylprolyl isomerase [Geminocystis sp. GBBB08]
MNPSLQVGDVIITPKNIFPLLAEKQMIAPLAREIILDEAIAHIQCTPEETAIAQQQFFMQMQLNTEDTEKLKLWLTRNYLTREQLQERILRGIKLEKYKVEKWGNQIESYYLKRKRELDKIIYSLIRTKNAGEAQELYFRISEGEKEFAELARQYSQGAEAETGGLIGPVELTIPHPEISQKLMTSQPGQVLPPMRIGEWIVILRLEKYLAAQLDQNMQRRLLDELFNTWLNEIIQTQVQLNLQKETVTENIE